MTDTTDPTTGFISRNSQTAEQYRIAQAEARMAARRAEPTPSQQWGDVGQGTAGREPVDSTFTAANLGNHEFYMAHKAEILEAASRGELPGQPNHAASPLNLN